MAPAYWRTIDDQGYDRRHYEEVMLAFESFCPDYKAFKVAIKRQINKEMPSGKYIDFSWYDYDRMKLLFKAYLEALYVHFHSRPHESQMETEDDPGSPLLARDVQAFDLAYTDALRTVIRRLEKTLLIMSSGARHRTNDFIQELLELAYIAGKRGPRAKPSFY